MALVVDLVCIEHLRRLITTHTVRDTRLPCDAALALLHAFDVVCDDLDNYSLDCSGHALMHCGTDTLRQALAMPRKSAEQLNAAIVQQYAAVLKAHKNFSSEALPSVATIAKPLSAALRVTANNSPDLAHGHVTPKAYECLDRLNLLDESITCLHVTFDAAVTFPTSQSSDYAAYAEFAEAAAATASALSSSSPYNQLPGSGRPDDYVFCLVEDQVVAWPSPLAKSKTLCTTANGGDALQVHVALQRCVEAQCLRHLHVPAANCFSKWCAAAQGAPFGTQSPMGVVSHYGLDGSVFSLSKTGAVARADIADFELAPPCPLTGWHAARVAQHLFSQALSHH